MRNIIKKIFSMEVMIVLLFLLALSCAVATFIENDFGPLGSRSLIYGQTWFEFIMLLLTIGIALHIIWFKMYKKSKIFILLIHISLIFIFFGAGLTRYYGFEATMVINEGEMSNKILSSDEYIKIQVDDKIYEKKVLMTPLNQTSFDYSTKINTDDLNIKFKQFIKNGVEKLVIDEKGTAMMDILVSEVVSTRNFLLKNSETIDTKYINFYLNKEENSEKPAVYFTQEEDKFYIHSNITLTMFTEDMKLEKSIKANEKIELNTSIIYKVGPSQFKVTQALQKASLQTVSASMYEVPKNYQLDALVFDVNYKGLSKKITLFGKGQNYKGIPKSFEIDGKKVTMSWGSKEFLLPFHILLNDFKLDRYPGSKAPSSYMSEVKVYDKESGEAFNYDIYMNNVLDYKGYRFFQSSYKEDESATILSVNKDPGKIMTYVGYFFLFLGLILSLLVKNGRFKKLAMTKYEVEEIKELYYKKKNSLSAFVLLISLTFITNISYASETLALNINKEFSKTFGETLIQDYQGRIKPINSLAIEIMNKTTRSSSYKNLDSNQLFLSMMIFPEYWKEVELFKVKSPKLKNILQIEENNKYIKFNDIFTKEGNYKLENFLEVANSKKISQRDKFDKELIKLDEKLNIIYTLFNGDFFRAFPLKDHDNNKWINLNEATAIYGNKEVELFIKDFYFTVLKSCNTNNWENSFKVLNSISQFQNENSNLKLPSEFKTKAEIFFNSFNIFEKLTPFYLILGFTLLALIFINIFKSNFKFDKVTKITLYLLIIAFIFHTFGLGLRWYISGHAPWSNGYESMIYIAWALTLSGIYFSRQSHMALATTSILSGITLFVAHLSWMEPQITTLVPVLKSYWLTIHVSVITASYGFLALSSLLGFIALILFILINKNRENESFFKILVSIKEANRINMMAIFIGLAFLVIGNFLGAIWANESWGRYWGWDPKETWTLISIIIYTIIVHLKYVKNILSDYYFALLSSISYATIVMTYFGVNYFLSGKHSYAAGDPIPIPTFVYVTFVVFVLIAILGYRNRKVI